MRHLGIVASSTPNIPPTVATSAATGVTESRAVLNGTVSANFQSTTVQFQYSKQSNFSTIDGTVTAAQSPVTGQSVSVSFSLTGLPINDSGQLYYFRIVATNNSGTSTSSATTFTTWRKYSLSYTTVGNHTFTVPTIAGVAPAALPLIWVTAGGGGGGGSSTFGGGGGGGGGGYRYATNVAFTGTSGFLNISVGGAGAGGAGTNGDTTLNPSDGVSGQNSQISGTNFPTYTAGGGESGKAGAGRGGNVGSGDNPAYAGGSIFTSTDKFGTSTGGGGAGIGGNGGNGANGSGGAGGAGALGISSGGGGSPNGAHGSPTSGYGLGGNGGVTSGGEGNIGLSGSNGTAGFVNFDYYGPV